MASHGIARTSRTRSEEQKAQDRDKIAKYTELEAQIRSRIDKEDCSPEVLQLTSKLLKLNPEYYTIWNDRRRLLISGSFSRRSAGSWPSRASPSSSRTATTTTSSAASSSSSSTETPPAPGHRTAGRSGTTVDMAENDLGVLRSELAFTIPLLMEFPKCYWIWKYRLWLLQQAIQRLDAPTARRVWEEELGLTSKMLAKDRRNFHAWGYRRNVVAQLESPALEGGSLAETEFEYTTKMIRADLSNFSAWHRRSMLIPRLLDERGADDLARKSFFEQELGIIGEALNVGPEDQSLWYYHQHLMLNLTDYIGRPTITPRLSQEERVTYLTKEIDGIKDLLEDYDDIKWIYEVLMEYTVALPQLEERQPEPEEVGDLKGWLSKLRELDPMRNGRWNDMEVEYGLGRQVPTASRA